MTVGAMNITITLNNGQFTAALTQSGVALQQFTGVVRGANSAVTTAGSAFSKFGTRLRDTVITLGLARNAVLNVWTVFGALPAQMVRVTAEFERMNVLLTNMSTKSSFAEKMADGKVQFEEIINLARTAPFSITAIQDAWVKFKSAGLDPANGSLQSLLDAVAAFGGTDDILKRASIAIQQMAGKGVISMEELRQQLGEAVPTAMQNLADATGVSVSELAKKISKGGVQAQESLKSLFVEFERLYGGQAQKLMGTFSGQLSVLTTEMKLFSNAVVQDSGLFDTLKGVMAQLTEGLKDPAVQSSVTALAAALGEGIKNLALFTGWVIKNAGELMKWVTIIGSAILGVRVLLPLLQSMVAFFIASLGPIRNFILWMQILVGIFVTSGIQAGIANTMTLLRGLFVLSPVGWATLMIGALSAVVAWLVTTGREADNAREKLAEFGESATADQIKDGEKALEQRKKQMERLREILKEGQEFVVSGNTGAIVLIGAERRKQIQAEYDELKALLKKEEGELSFARMSLANRNADMESRQYQTIIRDKVDEIRARYLAEQRAERDRINATISDNKKAATEYGEFVKTSEARRLAETTKFLEILIDKQQKKLATASSNAARRTIVANIDYLRSIADSTAGVVKESIASRERGLVDMFAGGEDANKKDPLGTFVEGLERKIARLRALLSGEKDMPAELADFEERLTRLRGGGAIFDGKAYSEAAINRAREMVKQQAELNDERERQKNLDTQQKYSFDQLDTLLASTTAEYVRWQTVLKSGGVDQTNTSLASLIKQLEKLRENIRPEKLAEFDKLANQVRELGVSNAAAEVLSELNKELARTTLEIASFGASPVEVIRAQNQERVRTIELAIQQNNLTAEQAERIREVTTRLGESNIELEKMRSPLRQMLFEWKDITTRMADATADWVNQGVDKLIEFVATGKSTFKEFAKSILTDIARIILRAMIAQAILAAIGVKPGQTTSTGSAFKDILGNMFGANIGAPETKSANGNIMTSDGPMRLRKYANGGIARRPQVSIFGEGSMPEAYVPLPDGRTIPVTLKGGSAGTEAPPVTVNVINQTGQQVNAEQQGQPRFDGNQFVLDVVIKAMNQPGQFRDSMRTAVR
jgi:lambda family phage tail tape measure protein